MKVTVRMHLEVRPGTGLISYNYPQSQNKILPPHTGQANLSCTWILLADAVSSILVDLNISSLQWTGKNHGKVKSNTHNNIKSISCERHIYNCIVLQASPS